MSHIVDDEPPIRSKTSQAYRDGWDRIFGDEELGCTDWVYGVPDHDDNTGLTCRNALRSVTLEALDHDACYECNTRAEKIREEEKPSEADGGDLRKECPHCGRPLDKHGLCPDL